MATAYATDQRSGAILWTYAALASQNGDAIESWLWPDRTIQAFGSGTVTLEGSPDGTHWVALSDQDNVAISIAAASQEIAFVLENPRYIRAVVAGGTSLVVISGSH